MASVAIRERPTITIIQCFRPNRAFIYSLGLLKFSSFPNPLLITFAALFDERK